MLPANFARRIGIVCGFLAWVQVMPVFAQSAPKDPGTTWKSDAQAKFEKELEGVQGSSGAVDTLDPTQVHTLAELIDRAEQKNPRTRIAWEAAKQQAARLGIARSTLYPFLASQVFVGKQHFQILAGPEFVGQDVGSVQPAITLYYTIFDFGRREGLIDAAKFESFSANFSFNETHQRIIFEVAAGYYQLLGAQGEVEAARSSLTNAQTVQEAVEARLNNGLATLPNVLEARSLSAQATYELERARGEERVSRGRLAEAVNTPPTDALLVEDISKIPTPEALKEMVDSAIQRALRQRPDLLAQMAKVDATGAEVKEARSNFYPTLSFDGNVGHDWSRGTQTGNPQTSANPRDES
jgi:outer membrane protein TolC